MTPDVTDVERDALAILAAAIAEDLEGVGTVIAHANMPMVIGMLTGMLIEALRDRYIDPAEWVAGQQDRARDEMA